MLVGRTASPHNEGASTRPARPGAQQGGPTLLDRLAVAAGGRHFQMRMTTRQLALAAALLLPLACTVDSSGLLVAGPGGAGGMILGSGGTGVGGAGTDVASATGGVIGPDGGRDANVDRNATPDMVVPPMEAGPEVTPGAICADKGGKLNAAGVCAIDCSAQGACPNQVTCPIGQPCQVKCGASGCAKGVDCTGATTCDITCGQSACAGPITCAGAQCTLTCSGGNSCKGAISSVAANSQISCSADNACAGSLTCSGDRCSITCSGGSSCSGGISTFANNNTITCSARNSCSKAMSCNGSTCVVSCANNACAAGVTCNAGTATGCN